MRGALSASFRGEGDVKLPLAMPLPHVVGMPLVLVVLALCASRAIADESPAVVDLSADTFSSTFAALDPSRPCLVEFYASW